jgi:glycosyltransferase involved in cell wall biosynthesis
MNKKRFHICETSSSSGVAKYALDFQSVVLEPHGYQLVSPSEIKDDYIKDVQDDQIWHLQLGAMQYSEMRVLKMLIKSGVPNVDVTLHDPPFLTFPYFPFKSKFLMRLSRGFDWYLNSFGLQRNSLKRLRRIYVLSNKGRDSLLRLGISSAITIPHVVRPESIVKSSSEVERGIGFFGFVGPNKGLEYVLRLHERITNRIPGIKMHVIGRAIDQSQSKYFERIKTRYSKDVKYYGYVNHSGLEDVFAKIEHVFLPFEKYKYFVPASGSLINCLMRGKVVWVNPVNCVDELVADGDNGLFFSGNLDVDSDRFLKIYNNSSSLDIITSKAVSTAFVMRNYDYAQHFKFD